MAVIGLFVLAAAVLLYAKGQPLMCACGTLKFWAGSPNSSENSQQLTDWYTFSHILHGVLFYAAWRIARRAGWRLSFWGALVLATGLECAWEVFENSEFIINRYRTATISLNYHGDSVINSVVDILAMIVGFSLAARLPPWATIVASSAMEGAVGLLIRDNFTLNIIMLVHPFEAIRLWQGGA